MCRSMVDIQSPTDEIRRGIKKRKIEDRKKPHGKNIMFASATQGDHNNKCDASHCTRVMSAFTRQNHNTLYDAMSEQADY